eukprot:8792965-Pyramimonas_sp.AAC.1
MLWASVHGLPGPPLASGALCAQPENNAVVPAEEDGLVEVDGGEHAPSTETLGRVSGFSGSA